MNRKTITLCAKRYPSMTRAVPQIGLTGSIGSGKSTVAELFRAWGSKIIDADLIARELLGPNTAQSQAVIKALGPQVTRPDGSLDRFALRSLIFMNDSARIQLEAILHPEIRLRMQNECRELLKSNPLSITFVIPLLFESELPYSNLSHTIAVIADRDTCLKRASRRDSAPESITSKILDAQLPNSEKKRLADFVIENNGSLEELTENARDIFRKVHS